MNKGPLPQALDPHLLDPIMPLYGGDARVALVTMPFLTPSMPSIQLGLLKALLAGRGIASSVYCLNLPFARALGYNAFNALAELSQPMLGEWLFGSAAFGPRDDDDEFLERFSPALSGFLRSQGWSAGDLLHIRNRLAPDYIDLCAAALPWDRYAVVGFSSVFQQNTASVALARRIKESFPGTLIVFGGANFDDPMGREYMRAFRCIDAACIGEADEVFPRFVGRVLSGETPDAGPGLAIRRGPEVLYGGPSAPVADLSGLPTPDYDEFVLSVEALKMFDEWEQAGKIRLPFEGSRGCWWGQKSHCLFCGLRSDTIMFRQKPVSRVVEDMRLLSDRYRWTTLYAVDNIMDPRFPDRFLGELDEDGQDLDICYEVKANLTREQMRTLRNARITTIQPGIESFSSRLLRLVKKGVSGLANVEMMKWARFYSVRVYWNMLTAIPGERAEDYTVQADWVRSLYHLHPPDKIGRVRLERNSPYHEDPGSYAIGNMRPEESYSFVYPPEIDLSTAACFFEGDGHGILAKEAYKDLEEEVGKWQAAWRRGGRLPELTYRKVFDLVFIMDARLDDGPRTYIYSGPEAGLYHFCRETRTQGRCLDYLGRRWGAAITASWFDRVTAGMIQRRLVIREGSRILSLATPLRRVA